MTLCLLAGLAGTVHSLARPWVPVLVLALYAAVLPWLFAQAKKCDLTKAVLYEGEQPSSLYDPTRTSYIQLSFQRYFNRE